ncbi:MAG: heavy metal translocating P-type ATPase [Synergistaceae bacterium]|nr:heavy metal translocating P-type ATPase [Synergistaceae bacterium]
MPESRVIEALLETQSGVMSAAASHITGSILIHYEDGARDSILEAIRLLDETFYRGIDIDGMIPASRESLGDSLLKMTAGVLARSLLPAAIRGAITFFRALPLLFRGLESLGRDGRLNVSVLDAFAIGASMYRRDFSTAALVTTLLGLGDLLESWTRKKSRDSLADSLAIHVDKLWIRKDGQETLIPMRELEIGDEVVIRAGSVIPVDGVVVEGEAMVNQSAMTGESEAILREPGLSVYAGSVVEEGGLVIRATAFDRESRIHKIVELIDESEERKADIQNRAEKLADAIVPYSILLAGGVYLFTRDAAKAMSALLVDYSCAIKLSTPLAFLSAMREAGRLGILVKGGRFLESLAAADTVVFDKTGTLTVAVPSVSKVVPFSGWKREEVLRNAACLEEHFPHSIARAVVKQAEIENLTHKEKHSTVEYLAAHGIVSHIEGKRALLGSAHFVFEHGEIVPTAEQKKTIDRESAFHSVLYLAIGDNLAGIICIEDPLRDDAHDVVCDLHGAGVRRVVMLTGDNAGVAGNVAAKMRMDEVYSQLLPEDKAGIINRMKQERSVVVMVGDGINDSPALASADVGVAMHGGADITREVADVVLTENRLRDIVVSRKLAEGLMRKIYRNYAYIVSLNSLLLALGITGTISPGMSALLHNMSTIGSSVFSMMPILDTKNEEEKR